MKKYNLFVLMPNLTDEEIEVIKKNVEQLITKVGATIIKTEEHGKRKLSYIIKKIRQGFYMNYILEMEAEKVPELNNELKRHTEILRFEISNFVEGQEISGFEMEENKFDMSNKNDSKIIKENKTEKFEELNKEKKVEKPLDDARGDSSGEELEEKKEGKKVDLDQLDKKLDDILK